MTIAPLTPAAAPVPTTGAAAGSNPGDFLAAMLDALAPEAGTPAPVVEPVETVAAQPPQGPSAAVPDGDERWLRCERPGASLETPAPQAQTPAPDVEPVETPTTSAQNPGKHLGHTRTDHPGLHLGLDHVAHPVNPKHVETPEDPASVSSDPCPTADTVPTPVVPDPTVVATPVGQVVPTPETSPRLDKLDARGVPTPGPSPRLDKLDVQAEKSPDTAPRLDQLDVRGASLPTGISVVASVAAPGATTAPATAPQPALVNAPAILDQVFGQVTGLVSRGNGTHRITLNLQPEQLGDVRVVLTVRNGAVHVRLAAGQEARAALLEGSPELKQLLERAGATDTRIEVRQLPAPAHPSTQSFDQAPQQANSQPATQPASQPATQPASQPATQPATQTPATDTASTQLTGGDRSPDRHAGTRADHLATDGDDGPRGHRSGGRRDVTPIGQVNPRAAGLDLTM